MDPSANPEKLTPEAKPRRGRFGFGALLAVALLSITLTAGGMRLLGRATTSQPALVEKAAAAAAPARGMTAEHAAQEVWTCPMHPTIIQDHPGECPICGMKLVKKAAASAASDEHAANQAQGLASVNIDPSRQQLIGLRTAPVERGQIGASWRTVGRVAVDERRVRHINVKIGGFVERVFVDFVGKPVKQGQALFSIYSPDLVAAQEEYLLALKTRGTLGSSLAASGDDLVAASRRKLRLWDIPDSDIAGLEQTGEPQKTLILRSPISGVVVKKEVVEGMQLAAGAMPYEIVDLSTVWVLADIYESELRRVVVGMPATFTLGAFPDRTFKGKVAFIDPMLDPTTRTVKVRLEFSNRSGELRPEMFGEAVLETEAREALRIPVDAVIQSGTRTVVFVAIGEGKFQPRALRAGESDGHFIEVLEGVAAGERVVTRANFLIDSESRLRASLDSMANQAPATGAPAEPKPAASPGGHPGH